MLDPPPQLRVDNLDNFCRSLNLADVISFHNAVQLSFVQLRKQLFLYATSSRPRLEVAAADVFDAFQTTPKVLDQFQLVLHVAVLVPLQVVDVEAKL